MNTSPTNSPLLLCLHGWGGSGASFDALRNELKDNKITILTPDLPGFGNEAEPNTPWTVEDYANWIIDYIKNLKFAIRPRANGREEIRNLKFFLLGHSHGGRIAIKIASEHKDIKIDHLFLCAAAGIRHKKHFKRIFGLTLAKFGNLLLSLPIIKKLKPIMKKLMYKILRVHDYEQASEIMRKTMINISAEDLRPLLKDIQVPTDIFWGEDDGYTPFCDAKIMEAEIKNSTLHSFKGVRHAVHKEKAKEIATIIKNLI